MLMFTDFKNAFDSLRSFVEWCKTVPEYLSGMFPSYIVLAFGTFFIILAALLLIKLVKGLIELISGIASGFII